MADPIAMLQSVLDPEMPLSERAAIQAAIDEIERLRAEVGALHQIAKLSLREEARRG